MSPALVHKRVWFAAMGVVCMAFALACTVRAGTPWLLVPLGLALLLRVVRWRSRASLFASRGAWAAGAFVAGPAIALGLWAAMKHEADAATLLLGALATGAAIRTLGAATRAAVLLLLALASVTVMACSFSMDATLHYAGVLAVGVALFHTAILLERLGDTGPPAQLHRGARRRVVAYSDGAAPNPSVPPPVSRHAWRVAALAVPLALLLFALLPRSLPDWMKRKPHEPTGAEHFQRGGNRSGGSSRSGRSSGGVGRVGPSLRDDPNAVTVAYGGVAKIKRDSTPFLEVRVRGRCDPAG